MPQTPRSRSAVGSAASGTTSGRIRARPADPAVSDMANPKTRSRKTASRPGARAEAGDGSVKTLHLGLDVLEYLVRTGIPKGVTDLADHFQLTKARTFRLLQTLADRGYLVQDTANSRYLPSIKLFALGQALGERFDFASAAKPEATQLWESLGHTVVTATPFRDKLLILDVMRGRTPISVGLKTGAMLDLHSSAQGRVALAFGSTDVGNRVMNEPMTAHTPRTIATATRLAKEVRKVRLQGWSSAPDQLVLGMNAVAGPVFQHDGTLAGTLGVCGLTQFVPHPPTPELIDHITSACWRASRKLGWSGKIVSERQSP